MTVWAQEMGQDQAARPPCRTAQDVPTRFAPVTYKSILLHVSIEGKLAFTVSPALTLVMSRF